MAWWDGIKDRKIFGITWWYFFYPLKWKIFVKGTIKAQQVPFEFCEIVVYRAAMCRECLDAGKCLHCGCKTPDSFMVLENWCSGDNWNATTIEQWKDYKERTKLKLVVEYGA